MYHLSAKRSFLQNWKSLEGKHSTAKLFDHKPDWLLGEITLGRGGSGGALSSFRPSHLEINSSLPCYRIDSSKSRLLSLSLLEAEKRKARKGSKRQGYVQATAYSQ